MVSRKLLTSTFAALTLGTVALASAPASALTPYPYYGYSGGYVAAGVIGCMALGAIAASAAASAHTPVHEESECYIVRRKVHTSYGLLIRKVRVCE
jgi:uncharacterized membrane protein YedE/YeeE